MKCNKLFKEFICFFDTYASSFQVQFRYKTSFKTRYGGIISTIIIILGLAALIVLYIFFESRDEQKIVTFRQRYYEPPELHISSNYSNVSYSSTESNYGYFFYSIYFLDLNTSQAMTLEEISKTLIFTSQDILFINGDKKTTDIQFIKCSDIYSNMTDLYNHPRLSDSYCAKNLALNVQGDFISEVYHYVLLRLTKKSNEDLTEYLSTLKVMIYRSDYTINTQIKRDSPITYIIKSIDILLENSTNLEENIFVAYNTFRSNDNIYAPWATKKIQTCFKVDKIITQYLPQDDQYRLMSLYLRSSYQYENYHRNFKSFFELFAQIGGVYKVLIVIGTILVVPINRSLMNVAISNKMFNMVHPNNESDVQMTYKQYLAKEEQYDLVPEIFRSLNPVLKQMSIEYYKYERNKGMDFSLREELKKVICCCCRNEDLNRKRSIFKSSGREIEMRLDTITIARFAQESKAMNRIFFGNDFNLLGYIMATNIDYSLLGQIRQQSNQQYVFSKAKPLSIVSHKQNLLVTAFNILRNQGDLTKLDILMIKLFNLDPNLVMKFFITYCDRFELIYPEFLKKSQKMRSEFECNENKMDISINKKKCMNKIGAQKQFTRQSEADNKFEFQ